ncbi:hypothetical protein Leryth_013577 [Lithospermum erythrorhizon]|nr:hypothetical protein Leryth_013577 [Lithospermum erythrorhizon]
MMKEGDREFSIFTNNEIAESNADLIKWGGGHGEITLGANIIRSLLWNQSSCQMENKLDAILNRLEIFKMSNPDNHLTSWNAVHHIQSPTSSWLPKQRKNSIATMLTVIITSLNIVVYYLRRLSERSSDATSTSSQCHQFSLEEILSTTNNFHHEYLIGSGGYGKEPRTRMLSFKTDVYAFGVVLLEVLAGRPAVDMRLPDEQHSLAAWAQHCIINKSVDGIIDRTLLQQIAPACLTKYVEIAQRCLKRVPRERPSMFDVVRHLESALVLQQKSDSDEVAEYTSIGNDSNISKRAKPGLKEKDFRSTVPSKKWWNLYPFFQRSPKSLKGERLQKHISKSASRSRDFSFEEILVATNNFANSFHINIPGTESVCKGKIDDGKRVVVFRSYLQEKTPPTMQELQSILGVSPSENHAPAASYRPLC